MTLLASRGDGVDTDGADDGGVAQGRLGGDDAVRDVVVDGRVLLLLDLQLGAVLEGPLDDVGLVRGALDPFAVGQLGPPLRKGGQLDEVPDVGEVGLDNGRLLDVGGRGDGHAGGVWKAGGRHLGMDGNG